MARRRRRRRQTRILASNLFQIRGVTDTRRLSARHRNILLLPFRQARALCDRYCRASYPRYACSMSFSLARCSGGNATQAPSAYRSLLMLRIYIQRQTAPAYCTAASRTDRSNRRIQSTCYSAVQFGMYMLWLEKTCLYFLRVCLCVRACVVCQLC